MTRIASWLFGLAAAGIAASAQADFHLFQVNEVFSSADGKIQFVEMLQVSEDGGIYGGSSGNGEHLWLGNTLVSSFNGSQKAYVFLKNLDSPLTAGRRVLLATQGFADLGVVPPDYIFPDGFLYYPAGALNYANVDFFNYTNLPADGRSSIDRGRAQQTSSPTNFAGVSGTVQLAAVADGVVEFYNTVLDHFFLTASGVEATSIDGGGSGPGWTRTGNVFKSGGTNAVCRFYGVQSAGGPNGHFYTADPDECNQVKNDPGWHFESLDFATTPPAAGGVCPQGLLPVYRAYNKRFAQQDSNHRITANLSDYQRQVAAGWQGEGVVMCASP